MSRGSREHILKWTDRADFYAGFLRMLDIPECARADNPYWMPRGHASPGEARLDLCGARLLPSASCWDKLAAWWLAYRPGANTPNWDLAVSCRIKGRNGLVLVEAKAHEGELDWEGKRLKKDASDHSISNHARIGHAIKQASDALSAAIPGVALSRDSHYQLANRIAHGWKLAALNVPVILVYLGFTGDNAVGSPLKDGSHWESLMKEYLAGVVPQAFVDRWIPCGDAEMRMVVRSRPARG